MGGKVCRVVDGVLFVYFAVMSIVAPLLDAPTCLPSHLVPAFSVEFKRWFNRSIDDYLMTEEPHHVVGILSLELFFQWPLAIATVYAIATRKSWFTTTALIHGVSALSCTVGPLFEMTLSKRASGTMFVIYYMFVGFGVLAMFRGVYAALGKGQQLGPLLHTKKMA